MDPSEKRERLPPPPAFSHRHPFLHHRCLELSPHCPQHGGYLLRPNSQHHDHSQRHHMKISPDCALHGYLLPHCPLHGSNFHSSNPSTTSFPFSPNSVHPFPVLRSLRLSNPNVNSLNFKQPEADRNPQSEALMRRGRIEEEVAEEEEEEEEEIIFVLTDEWKEFFAKSEAKRKLEKKQAKKKGKD